MNNITNIKHSQNQIQSIIAFETIINVSTTSSGKLECSMNKNGYTKDIDKVIHLEQRSDKHIDIVSGTPDSWFEVMPKQ